MLLVVTGLLAAAAASLARNPDSKDCDDRVQAWVRAEDLRPAHISHGELRIKVNQENCSHRIDSVSLRLQLDEFSEVKYLRRGAVLPEIRKAENQTRPADFGYWGSKPNDVVYDYSEYDKAMGDSNIWAVKAEERRAWSTETILFENNPDFSRAMVTPFIVAAPAVNYPPSVEVGLRAISGNTAMSGHGLTLDLIRRHAYSQLGYHYIAVVNFTDGRMVDLPAGHTNFVPTSAPLQERRPFSWNTTFTVEDGCRNHDNLPQSGERSATMERCLPEELRSVFVAEVTLDEGNVVQRGQPLKGKVTVHATNGSTTMSEISVSFTMTRIQHWATEQATTGGDDNFSCQSESRTHGVISIDDSHYAFRKEDDNSVWTSSFHYPSCRGPVTPARPYFDFELKVPETTPPDFSSYYSSEETVLGLELSVLYSSDVAVCIDGIDKYAALDDELEKSTDSAKTEEGLWDSYTRVGQPIHTSQWRRTLRLKATVPLVVLGDISARPAEHYLKPGLPSPVILPAQGDVVFPAVHPVTIEEPLANTSARLMRAEGTFDPSNSGIHSGHWHMGGRDQPDPSRHYNQGNYAGLLWKKKLVAEERGILPAQSAGAGVAHGENADGQHRFVMIP
ncbi:hypothetical protein DFH07DRAFT_829387 [Mycena maculata]|uniref:Uncharacterized protein n=1 Tax=Mycena maculata TaxID=230809 RepID=A0AAD7IRI4_9AGAR|nr:hypothetical protein DFH07DRAFT_829387 [Mycena maculata]